MADSFNKSLRHDKFCRVHKNKIACDPACELFVAAVNSVTVNAAGVVVVVVVVVT